MIRKYQLVYVSNEVYCSSSGHYSVMVKCRVLNRAGEMVDALIGDYLFNGDIWKRKSVAPKSIPKYLEKAIDLTLQRKYQAGELRFHEYDRDGNKRYENLRYHDERHFAWQIGLR